MCLSVISEEHILWVGDQKASLHTKWEMPPRPVGLQPRGHRGGEGGSVRGVIWVVTHWAWTRSWQCKTQLLGLISTHPSFWDDVSVVSYPVWAADRLFQKLKIPQYWKKLVRMKRIYKEKPCTGTKPGQVVSPPSFIPMLPHWSLQVSCRETEPFWETFAHILKACKCHLRPPSHTTATCCSRAETCGFTQTPSWDHRSGWPGEVLLLQPWVSFKISPLFRLKHHEAKVS